MAEIDSGKGRTGMRSRLVEAGLGVDGFTALALGSLLLGALAAPPAALGQAVDQTQVLPVNDLPNPYRTVEPWGDVPDGSYDERTAFIGVEQGPDGNIYVLHRCRGNSCADRPEPPILKLDPEGNLLAAWGEGLFSFPHGFAVDGQGNVWATDQRGHQVFKWSADGDLLMTIGERGRAGDPPGLLSEPTDVAVAPNGDVFITEGHSFADGVNRVSKFRADGTFVLWWGGTGSAPGAFNVPHTIAVDRLGRVLVGDRANNRIQLFDQSGTFLEAWYQFGRPSGIAIGPDDRIYVADSESFGTDNPGWKKGIRVGNALSGTVEYLIEDIEPTAIEHSGAEGVGVDSEGNVYGAVVRRRMLERHEPAPGPSVRRAGASSNPHVGHLASGFGQTPEGRGLVATATTDAGTGVLHSNLAAGNLSDLDAMRRRAEQVLHTLEPDEVDDGPGTGFGLVRALEALATHAELAARDPGASGGVRSHAEHVRTIASAVARKATVAASLARELRDAPSIRRAAPLVARLRAVMYALTEGYDEDGDGAVSLEAEAGLQQLEAHTYLLLEAEGLPRLIR